MHRRDRDAQAIMHYLSHFICFTLCYLCIRDETHKCRILPVDHHFIMHSAPQHLCGIFKPAVIVTAARYYPAVILHIAQSVHDSDRRAFHSV